MTLPMPVQGPQNPYVRQPRPRARRPFGHAFGWLVGISVLAGLLGALVVTALLGILDAAFTAFFQTLEEATDGTAETQRSLPGDALIRAFGITAGALLAVSVVGGTLCLALLRLGDWFATLNTFVQGLMAWLLALTVGLTTTILVLTVVVNG